MLEWPPLAATEVPREMGTILERFLAAHLLNPMPLNLAVAAIIIFFDLKKMGWKSEGFVKAKDWVLQTISPPSLGVFIIYFKHLLRFARIALLPRSMRSTQMVWPRDVSTADALT